MDLHVYKQYKNMSHSFTYIYNFQIYMQSDYGHLERGAETCSILKTILLQ